MSDYQPPIPITPLSDEKGAQAREAAALALSQRRSASVLFVGLIFTILGAICLGSALEAPRGAAEQKDKSTASAAGPRAVGSHDRIKHEARGQEAEEPVLATAGVQGLLDWWSQTLSGGLMFGLVGVLCLLVGGLCLPSRMGSFMVLSVIACVSAYCVDRLVELQVSRHLLAAAAFGTAYLMQCSHRADRPSARGCFGFLMVGLAGIGVVRGWYDWSGYVSVMPSGTARLLSDWRAESTWVTVVLLAAIGVASSRTRPIHFFCAVMLCAIGWYCVKSGSVAVVSFPELAKGDLVPSIRIEGLKNVAAWRWVVLAELGLTAAVLVHQVLGMGALVTGFAIGWMFTAAAVFHSIGTLAFSQSFSESFPLWARNMPAPNGDPRSGAATNGAGGGLGLFLPMGPTGSTKGGSSSIERTGAMKGSSVSRPGLSGPGLSGPIDPALEAQVAAIGRRSTIQEGIRQIWMLLTTVIGALVVVTGLTMMSSHEGYRAWLGHALWLALGLGLATLWFEHPKSGTQSWRSWALDFTQLRDAFSVHWVIFLTTVALAGRWALRGDAAVRPWVRTSIVSLFIGTGLSLVGVAMLIRFGGFPALPVWVYILVSVCQSSLAWVLLMSRADRSQTVGDVRVGIARKEPARLTPVSRQHR